MLKSSQEMQGAECAGANAPKWFAAYTASHHEKHVLGQLVSRNVEAYLPLYKASRKWQKRPAVTLDLPLFPNYVFVRIPRQQKVDVLSTPGVFSIVGSASHAWELPAGEIEALRHGLSERKVEPHPYLAVGERARVIGGLLAGLEGVVVRRKGQLSIILTLDQIMRSIAIEVDARELEPITERQQSRLDLSRPVPAREGMPAYQLPRLPGSAAARIAADFPAD